jgi:hypothetical protein
MRSVVVFTAALGISVSALTVPQAWASEENPIAPTVTQDVEDMPTDALPSLCVIPELIDVAPSPRPSASPSPSPSLSPTTSPSPSETETVSSSPTESPTERSGEIETDTDTEATPSPSNESDPLIEPSEPSTQEPVEETTEESESPSPDEIVDRAPASDTGVLACPVAPVDLRAEAGINEVRLTWTAGETPADDDRFTAPTYYYVSVTGPESRIVRATDPSSSILGLRNGVEYTFEVFAVTAGGRSSGSGSVDVTPTTGMEGVVAGMIVGFTENVQVAQGAQSVPGDDRITIVELSVAERVSDDSVLVEFSEPVDLATAQQIANDLAADELVEWAEPNQFFFTSNSDLAQSVGVPGDSQYATDQWNLWDSYGISVGDGAAEMTNAWAGNRGDGVTIAVIDTGITSHPDLDTQLVSGYDFVSDPEQLASSRQANAPPVAFDGDYLDEATFGNLGRDANPADPGDWRGISPVRNSSWHGTKIAGLIAAAANEEGITGIAPNANIQPIRALSWRGGLLSDIAASITWASGGAIDGVPTNANPSKVINMSFAVETICPTALQQAIHGAIERGSILIAAAGNANDDAAKFAPGNCDGVITVAATNRDGNKADYSNYGATIDIAAPGGDATNPITTTSNTGSQTPEQTTTSGDFGTSIAAAHVSAAAAILVSRNANITLADAYTQLTGKNFTKAFNNETCDTNNTDIACGTGILNLAQIAAACAPTERESGSYKYVAFKTAGTCEWTPPAGVSSVDYLVVAGGGANQNGQGGGGAGGLLTAVGVSLSTIGVGSTLSVMVGAGGDPNGINVQGQDSSLGLIKSLGGGQGGGVVGASGGSGGGSYGTPGGAGTDGQGNRGGSGYAVTGPSSFRSGGGGGAGAVGVDGSVSGVGGVGKKISWVTPSIAGSSALGIGHVVGTDVYFSGGGGGSSSTGLTPGGGGLGGGGKGSEESIGQTGGLPNTGGGAGGGGAIGARQGGGSGVVVVRFLLTPGPPTDVTATAGKELVSLSWVAPASTGSGSITGYSLDQSVSGGAYSPVTAGSCATASTSTELSCDVTGLMAGTSYTFKVAAINSLGTGSESDPSAAVTPFGSLTTFAVTATSGGTVGAQTAGIPFDIKITAQDSGGRTYLDFAGTVDLTSTSIFLSGEGATPDFVSGVLAARSVILTRSGLNQSITATVTGGSASGASGSFSIGAGPVVTLTQMTGNLQTATMGSAVPISPTVLAQDAFENVVLGASVGFSVTAGGGSLSSSSPVATNSSGIATSPVWTLGTTVGTSNNTLTAKDETIGSAIAVTFSASATARSITITATSPSVTFPTAITQSYSITSGSLGGSDAISSMTYTYTGTGDTTYGPSATAPTNVGTYSVTPSASLSPGDASNYTITYVPGTVTIAASSQLITFNALANVTYSAAPFAVAPTSSSGLPVTVSSTTLAVCAVSENVVTIVGSAIGGAVCSLTASQAGNANYSAAPDVIQTFTVAQANQAELEMTSPASAIFGQALALAAAGGSGTGTLSFSVTSPIGPGLCGISGSTLTLGDAGSLCKVQATKAASSNYVSKSSPEQTVIISKAGQTLAFMSVVPLLPEFAGTYTPTATAVSTVTGLSSGVAPVFAATGNCTLTDGVVTFGLPGICTLTSSAASNTNFTAAVDAAQVIEVGTTNQNITFAQPANVAFGSASANMGATASSGEPVTYVLGSGTTNTACSVSTLGVVTVLAVGTCEVTASAAAVAQFAAASPISRGFQVLAALPTAPMIVFASASSQAITIGFTAPGFTGGVPITAYRLVATPVGAGTVVTSTACTTSPCTIGGLTNGTSYQVTVAAINSAGTGLDSASSTPLTPATAAFAVGNLSTSPGNTVVDVRWSQPVDLGGGTFVRYDLYYRAVGGSYGTPPIGIGSIGTTTYEVTGLDNGTSYDFKVVTITTANGSEIPGNTAEVVQYPSTVPMAPRTPTVLASTATDVQFSWAAPISDGGAALGSPAYSVTVTGTGGAAVVTCTPAGAQTFCTASNLTNDAVYTFSVVANNRMGISAPISTTYAVPSSDASLSALVVTGAAGAVTLSPAFASNTYSYAATVDHNVATVTVTPTTTSATATIDIAGVAVVSGFPSSAIALAFGTNTIDVLVTASDPRSTSIYTITITRAAPISPSGGGGVSPGIPVVPPAPVMNGDQVGGVLLDGQVETDAAFTKDSAGTGWEVGGSGFTLSVATATQQRTPEPLLPSGAMQVPQGGFISVNATGYAPESTLAVFAIPRFTTAIVGINAPRSMADAMWLGSAVVGTNGSVGTSLQVPMTMTIGDYVLQLNGETDQAQLRSVNMQLVVVPAVAPMQAGMVQRAGFYTGLSDQFSSTGKRKLRSVISSIPKNAQSVQVLITGASVSLDSFRDNVMLAGKRAATIAETMKAAGVSGEFVVNVSAAFTVDAAERSSVGKPEALTTKSGKPLTTVTVLYEEPRTG